MSFFTKKKIESIIDSGNSSNLSKTLTAFDLVFLGLGAMVGTGIFALTGLIAAEHSGPAIVISYAIAGVTCIFVALVYTELATMLPTSGSVYTYSYTAFGQGAAWLVASILIIELAFACAAVGCSWSAYMQGVLDSAGIHLPDMLRSSIYQGGIVDLPALLIIIFSGFMLYRGTKDSKMLNNVLVVIKMTAIFIFIFIAAPEFDASNWENFMPHGFREVVIGSSVLFFAFTGFGTLASAAEECKNPKKDLVIGIVGSVILVTIIYVIVGGVLTGIVPFSELNNAQPLAYGLKKIDSNIGSVLVATGAISGMTTVIMVQIYGLSRIFYVVSRDGLLPKSLSAIHSKYDSPYNVIILFTVAISILAIIVPYDILAKMSSMGALTDYIVVIIIAMLFRKKYPEIKRSFKCPVIFIIAPIALLTTVYLLLQQILDANGGLLLTGKIFIGWIITMVGLYFIKTACQRKGI